MARTGRERSSETTEGGDAGVDALLKKESPIPAYGKDGAVCMTSKKCCFRFQSGILLHVGKTLPKVWFVFPLQRFPFH